MADVDVTREGSVLTITLNRPDVLNALNRSMHQGIFDGLEQTQRWRKALSERPSVRAAVGADYPQRLMEFLEKHSSILLRQAAAA